MSNRDLIENLSEVILFIERNLDDAIRLEDLPNKCFMSKSSFYEFFKAVIGISPKKYIRSRRLSMASHRLVNSDERIIDIALLSGYETPEAFSRSFKKYYGLSPQQYRSKGSITQVFPAIFLTQEMERSYRMENNITVCGEEQITSLLGKCQSGYLYNIDIDKFLDINNTYGREGGDRVLEVLPERLINALADFEDCSAPIRIAGDQFVVVVRSDDRDYIKKLAEIMLATTKEPIPFEGRSIQYTMSIGISEFGIKSYSGAFSASEEAMIIVKKKSRNGYHFI